MTTGRPPPSLPVALRGRRTVIGLYAASVFFYWASLYLYAPTLPSYAETKTDDLSLVGLVLAQYGLWQAVARLPLGMVSDWVGRRKPFILAGLALAGVGALVMGTASGVAGLLAGRAITGLAAATWVVLVAAFSSLFPPKEAVRVTSLLTGLGSVARMLATAITGSLNEWGGYRLAFLLATVTAALAVLVTWPAAEERRPRRSPSLGAVGRLVSRREVVLPSLLAAISQYANWTTTFSFMPLLAEQLGGTGVTQSVLLSTHTGLVIAGNLAAAGLARRFGANRMVRPCLVLLCAAIGVAALAPSLPLLFAAQVGIGLAQGVSYPLLMGLSIEPVADAERATAAGLHQAIYAVGMFGGPAVSGGLAKQIGIRPTFGLTALAVLTASLVLTGQLIGKADPKREIS